MSLPVPARSLLTQGAVPPSGNEFDAMTLMLDELGTIQHCDGAGDATFGYSPDELPGQHISMLLPQWAQLPLIENGRINSRLLYLCRIGGHFRAKPRSGAWVAIDVYLNDLGEHGSTRFRMVVRREESR